jgi:hypothetical protein
MYILKECAHDLVGNPPKAARSTSSRASSSLANRFRARIEFAVHPIRVDCRIAPIGDCNHGGRTHVAGIRIDDPGLNQFRRWFTIFEETKMRNDKYRHRIRPLSWLVRGFDRFERRYDIGSLYTVGVSTIFLVGIVVRIGQSY